MKDYFKKFSIEKRFLLRLIIFLFLDAILTSLSVLLAFAVRFEGQIPIRYFSNIPGIISLTLAITLPIFYFLRLYHFSWIYVSAAELISLIKATSLSFLLLTATFFILRDEAIFSGFPRSTLFISYFFIFIFSGGIRFGKRIYLQIFPGVKKGEKERTLIVGAGDAGEQILRNVLNSRYSPYLPIGFIDDNPAKQGILIHGIRVLGKIDDISRIIKEEKTETLIIALPSAGSQIIQKAAEEGLKAGVKKIKKFSSFGSLEEIKMEDLLGREPVSLDQKLVKNFIQGKRILVTGAAGSIGSELCRQIAKFNPQWLFLLDQDETEIFNISEELKNNFPGLSSTLVIADIQNKENIESLFKYFYPEIVFHAAAYKHVPLMEEYPEEAVKNNIFGTENIAKASINVGVEKFIFISTDKAVNPSSVMGATKRIGEMICQNLNNPPPNFGGGRTKFISVRFGNVLGSRGSVIPIFKEQISKGGPVKITHKDMKRYFMVTSEACLLVMQAGAMGQGGEVFVLDMGNPIRIIDLAKELIRRSGFEPEQDIKIEYTEPRPGEKFFEEILTVEEGTEATKNQKIFIAKISNIDEYQLYSGLEKIEKVISDLKLPYDERKEKIKIILKELIPSYQPGVVKKD